MYVAGINVSRDRRGMSMPDVLKANVCHCQPCNYTQKYTCMPREQVESESSC